MGLKDEIDADLKDVFATDLVDAYKSATYRQVTSDTYDPATGTNTKIFTDYSIEGWLDNPNSTDKYIKYRILNTDIDTFDIRFSLLQSVLSIPPIVNDVLQVDSIDYLISGVDYDPVGATWTLDLKGAN